MTISAGDPQMSDKEAESDADVIFMDLKHAVAPDNKEQALKEIIAALNEVD